MKRTKAKPKVPRKPKGKSTPPAVVKASPPADQFQAAAMVDLQDRLRKGEVLPADDVARLDAWLQSVGPVVAGRVAKEVFERRQSGEPDDLGCKNQRELAEVSGLHVNSVTNWKRAGITPLGEPPWSLKAWFLLLRKHGKLSETKPVDKKAQALRAWCFGNGDSSDPNDPAHASPQGWTEEAPRQTALKTMVARQKEQIELETLQKDRIPMTEYRERWRRRAQQVLGLLDGFMGVARHVPDLTEPQRLALNRSLRAHITEIRGKLATKQPAQASVNDDA